MSISPLAKSYRFARAANPSRMRGGGSGLQPDTAGSVAAFRRPPCGRQRRRKMPTLDFPSVGISDIALSNLPAVVIAQLGGETDGEQLSQIANEWLVERDYLYTLAVMATPDDPELA